MSESRDAWSTGCQETDAAAAYRRAIAVNADSIEAHAKLAALLDSASRLNEALTHLRRIVAIRPGSADAHNDLGGALAQAGFPDEAARHLRRALELDPNHTVARQNLERLTRGGRD